MLGRGKIINPFLAVIHPLDREGMAAPFTNAQGAMLDSGFDAQFGEPVLEDLADDGVGEQRTLWLPPVQVPVQVESVRGETERMMPAGDSPDAELRLVMHFADLERLGLVNLKTGNAMFERRDRLEKILTLRGTVEHTFNPPLELEEVEASGWGLNPLNPRRNLLITTWSPSQLGINT